MLAVETIVSGKWRENCYILHTNSNAVVVVDPGEDFEAIDSYLETHGLGIKAIVSTHAHYDHICSAAELKAHYVAPFYLHSADGKLLRQANFYRMLFGGQRTITIPDVDHCLDEAPVLWFDDLRLDVIHTPGHTPGSVCLLAQGRLFAGDTLFAKRLGRTDLPGGDPAALATSIERLFMLAPTTIVYPGHGPAATLAEILAINRDLAEMTQ